MSKGKFVLPHLSNYLFPTMLVVSLALCPAATPAQPNALSAASRIGTADVAVAVNPESENNAPAMMLVGQTIAVARPEEYDEWQVDFDAAALSVLTPPEKMRAPGMRGWLFRAIKPGETQVRLTSILPRCSREAPCPQLNPQRFSITLQVQP